MAKIIFTILLVLQLNNFGCNTTEPLNDIYNGPDTTSQNFKWEVFKFGEHSTSQFFDISIINDSSIWVVGDVYLNDSLNQPDPETYNAAYWNGKYWSLRRVFRRFPWKYNYSSPRRNFRVFRK